MNAACKTSFKIGLFVLISVGLLSFWGCEKEDTTRGQNGNDTDSSVNDTDTRPAPPGCGNKELTKDEACDDGNKISGDGCSANCLEVEKGYSCNPPGQACHLIAKCGDGKMSHPELCDDNNNKAGDGCSPSCKVEIGYKCEGSPSKCSETVCGDNKIEGAESCDDGNDIPFDGCSTLCQKEPDCSAGACSSECGDGLVLGEECDDGNNLDGDGCSADCKIEEGFECPTADCMDEENCTLKVAAIYRDFPESHSDFQIDQCDGKENAMEGLVENTLNDEWKPTATSQGSNCFKAFSDWYTKPADKVGELVLYPDNDGNFVNRYGENGEPWLGYEDNPDSGKPTPKNWEPWVDDYTKCLDDGCILCPRPGNTNQACFPPEKEFNGNPLFFPLDDLPGGDSKIAKVPEQYGFDGWPEESVIFPDAPKHNFYFTTEVTYWFKYDADNTAKLFFNGDDDVWVYVNGKLAADIGGTHVPVEKKVEIGGNTGESYGMEDGKVYKINIFHAERKTDGSSFKLTLGGFSTARSECRPDCGDGVIGLGEECDDGKNDGGYGECGKGCKLTEYCGDGVLQEEHEHCDPGLEDTCPNSCRRIVVE